MTPTTQASFLIPLMMALSADAWAGDEPPGFLLEWGSNGAGNGQFSGPHGTDVDADGNVYVADTGNDRIQKFTSAGAFLVQWGSSGVDPGELDHPHGIGVGPMGNVYVAETGNHRVQRFTAEGLFLTTWGSFGDGDGQFSTQPRTRRRRRRERLRRRPRPESGPEVHERRHLRPGMGDVRRGRWAVHRHERRCGRRGTKRLRRRQQPPHPEVHERRSVPALLGLEGDRRRPVRIPAGTFHG